MSMVTCLECGLQSDDGEGYCMHCCAPLEQSEVKRLKSYKLPDDLISDIIDCGFLEMVKDNCIIYFNGIVDNFDSPETMVEAIKNGNGLAEMAEDIHTIILDDKPCKVSMYDKVVITRPEDIDYGIESYFSQEDINGSKILVLMEGPTEMVYKFQTVEQLATWINKTEGKDIRMIFIDKVYHEWEIKQFIKIADMSVELDPIPF